MSFEGLLGSPNIENTNFTAKLVGTTFFGDAQNLLKVMSRVKKSDFVIGFHREKENPFDSNAIRVSLGIKTSKKRYDVGHIERESAEFMSFVIDGKVFKVVLKDFKILQGSSGFWGMEFFYHLNKI